MADAQVDVFDGLLNLEEQYYTEGYNLGVFDGSRSGRIEGRIFGLEKGFEKYLEMGRLSGKAAVWDARLISSDAGSPSGRTFGGEEDLIALHGSERLRKHVQRLQETTDAETLPTENSEEAVADFDERLKDAKAKATLISKAIERDESRTNTDRVTKVAQTDGPGRATTEMEDFVGLPAAMKTSDG